MSAVVAIERYRVENDITDRRTAIGLEPDEYWRAVDWRRVNDTVVAAHDTVDPPTRALHVAAQMVEAPALGIEL